MTIDHMRYFMEVAYCHSFSQAAQNLYISQPNLTKYIASLEKSLGVKLFDRTTRRVTLTEAGERLLSKAQTVLMPFLRELEDIQTELSSNRQNIYIGVARDEILPDAFLDVIRRYNLSDSGSRVILIQDNHLNLSNGIRTQYNIVITSDRQLRTLPGLNYLCLQSFRMTLAVSKRHPLANKPDLVPPDFRNELIYFAVPQGTNFSPGAANPIYYRIGGLVNIKLMPSPSDALFNASLCSGAAIIPDLTDISRFPDIQFVDFEENLDSTPTQQRLFWPREESDPRVLALLDELIQIFGPTQAN